MNRSRRRPASPQERRGLDRLAVRVHEQREQALAAAEERPKEAEG